MFPISLDREPVKVAFALSVAKKYYSEQDYLHALRVMQYVADNNKIPYEYQDECLSLAVMHDLLEDTEFTGIGLPENFRKALALLTKPDDQDYITYIKNIGQTDHTNWRLCAWWVKVADMKDHLMQRETLTEHLKEKYLEALPFLL